MRLFSIESAKNVFVATGFFKFCNLYGESSHVACPYLRGILFLKRVNLQHQIYYRNSYYNVSGKGLKSRTWYYNYLFLLTFHFVWIKLEYLMPRTSQSGFQFFFSGRKKGEEKTGSSFFFIFTNKTSLLSMKN